MSYISKLINFRLSNYAKNVDFLLKKAMEDGLVFNQVDWLPDFFHQDLNISYLADVEAIKSKNVDFVRFENNKPSWESNSTGVVVMMDGKEVVVPGEQINFVMKNSK